MLNRLLITSRRLIAIIVIAVTLPPVTALAVIDSLEYYQQQLKILPSSDVSFQFMKMANHAKDNEQKKVFYYSAIDAAKEYDNNDTICLRVVQIAWRAYDDADYQLAGHFIEKSLSGDFCKLTPQSRGEVVYCQGMCAYRTGDFRGALTHLKEAASLLAGMRNFAQSVSVLYSISDVYLVQGNDFYAIETLKEASSLVVDHRLTDWDGKIFSRLSGLYADNQNFAEALKYASMALDVTDPKERGIRIAAFSHMGDLYLKMNRPDQARRLFEKALELASDSLDGYHLQIKLAQTDLLQGNYQQARSLVDKSIKYAHTKADLLLRVEAHSLLGEIDFQRKDFSSAISGFTHALQLSDSLQNHPLKASILAQLAASYLAAGELTKAQSFFEQGFSVCYNHGLRYELATLYQGMSKLYRQQQDYPKALDLQCSYASLKDSLFSEGILNQMAQMEMKIHALAEKDFLQELRHENAFITHSIEQEKNKQLIFMCIAVVLFFISVIAIRLGYSNYRSGVKLKQKNKELADLNATKDKFFSIIAHDLKAPFNSLLGFSEMLTLHAENKSNKEVIEYSGLVHGAARKLYHLVENLLQWSRAQVGSVPYKPERLHIATQTSNVVSLMKMNAESKDIVLSQRIDPEIVAFGDANHYNTILRNLLSNAIKFSKVGSMVSIGAKLENDHVKVWVSDSGLGMPEEQQKKLFSISQNPSGSGTLNEKGSGLGLLICKEFVELNKGNIWVESQLGKGSVFNFTLPLHLN